MPSEAPPPILDHRLWPWLGAELAARLDARSFFSLRQVCLLFNVATIGMNDPKRTPHIESEIKQVLHRGDARAIHAHVALCFLRLLAAVSHFHCHAANAAAVQSSSSDSNLTVDNTIKASSLDHPLQATVSLKLPWYAACACRRYGSTMTSAWMMGTTRTRTRVPWGPWASTLR